MYQQSAQFSKTVTLFSDDKNKKLQNSCDVFIEFLIISKQFFCVFRFPIGLKSVQWFHMMKEGTKTAYEFEMKFPGLLHKIKESKSYRQVFNETFAAKLWYVENEKVKRRNHLNQKVKTYRHLRRSKRILKQRMGNKLNFDERQKIQDFEKRFPKRRRCPICDKQFSTSLLTALDWTLFK